MQVEPWLDGAASSTSLGMTPEELQTQLWDCTLPAVHGSEGQPRFRWRDLSLYRLTY